MFELIKARFAHGYQAIANPIDVAINESFPGLPLLNINADLDEISKVCPVNAIDKQGLDMGKCIFCGMCERTFPDHVTFSADYKMAADERDKLIIKPGQTDYRQNAITFRLPSIFRKSFALRNVSAAGCNACELELAASSNVNFDMGRYGIEVVASPRHADALILTGPVSINMEEALRSTWDAIPDPKFLILCGTCSISGGMFVNGNRLDRRWLCDQKAVLYIPGCPAHPLSILYGIYKIMGGK